MGNMETEEEKIFNRILILIIVFAFGILSAESDSVNVKDSTFTKEGVFTKIDDNNEYWFFYIIDDNSDTIKFIYDDEEITDSEDAFIDKKLRITYTRKLFENADSEEAFRENYLLQCDIIPDTQ